MFWIGLFLGYSLNIQNLKAYCIPFFVLLNTISNSKLENLLLQKYAGPANAKEAPSIYYKGSYEPNLVNNLL